LQQQQREQWPSVEVGDPRERKGGFNVILDAAFKARVIQFSFLLSSMILWKLERAQAQQQHAGRHC